MRYKGSLVDNILNKIPNSIINFISIISGAIGILTPIIGFLKLKRNIAAGKVENTYNSVIIISCIALICFCIILIFRVIKYKQLFQQTKSVTSRKYYSFLHDFRNTYFEILSFYKANGLTVPLLTKEVIEFLKSSLNNICDIYHEFTHQEVSACIKYIDGTDEELDINTATVKTFVRSTNSDVRRQENDIHPISIKDNTVFYSILTSKTKHGSSYFYKRNLIKYAENCKDGIEYENTTPHWERYYKSTIVVPIRIATERLFFKAKNDRYNILGFLCIDSLSTDAFLENQEKYNVLIAKSFAAEMYIILNQYKYYLSQITDGGQVYDND